MVRAAKALMGRPDIARHFAAVQARFLDQDPRFDNVDPEAVVVPFFMADGFFVQRVRKIAGEAHVAAPLGTATRALAEIAVALAGEGPQTLLLLGHGTRRNPNSAATTYAVADQIQVLQPSRRVLVGFIDQDPEIAHILAELDDAEPAVAVPFFASNGPHTTIDLPRALKGRAPLTDAVGTDAAVVDILARRALGSVKVS